MDAAEERSSSEMARRNGLVLRFVKGSVISPLEMKEESDKYPSPSLWGSMLSSCWR